MDAYEDYLAHHGIKGQKWGLRRFQNEDGSLTALGRERRGLSPETKKSKENSKDKAAREQRHAERKAAQQEKAAERKAEKEKKAAEDTAKKHEELKNYVRDHPKDVFKYRREFSQKEIDDLVTVIKSDQKLKDIRDEEIRRGWKKVQNVSDDIGKVRNLANNAKDLYNIAVDVNNTLVEAGVYKNGKKMLKVGEKAEKSDKTTEWFDKNLKAGNYATLYANRTKLTNSQLSEIQNRINREANLGKMIGNNSGYQGKHLP